MFLSLLAHAILRIVTGGIMCFLGYTHFVILRAPVQRALFASKDTLSPKIIGLWAGIEIIAGTMLVLGVLTQIGALIVFILSLASISLKRYLPHLLVSESLLYVLLCAVSVSLFITGAGVFAVDLPL